MPRLVVSAAHTSISPGAIYKDLREFDLTRKILEMTVKHLQAAKIDFKAVPVDLQLLDRINWINDTGFTEENGDIFIEIHVNDGGKRGIEGWYEGDEGEENNAQKLAEVILEELVALTKYESQGVKSEHKHELGSLLILNQTKPISVAFELLFIDNEEDYKILKDDAKLDELAKNFVAAIKKYLDKPPELHKKKQKKDPFLDNDFNASFPTFNNPFGDDSTNSTISTTNGNTISGSTTGVMMDREQRKKMIQDTYKKVVGKEPQQNDLNYYLNIGVSEEQLIKKLVESKDHEQMAKDSEEASELRGKFGKMETELIELRTKLNDMQAMHANLNNLLQHKNLQIKQMQDELVRRGVVKNGEYFDPHK